jgi:hypothetical protein
MIEYGSTQIIRSERDLQESFCFCHSHPTHGFVIIIITNIIVDGTFNDVSISQNTTVENPGSDP